MTGGNEAKAGRDVRPDNRSIVSVPDRCCVTAAGKRQRDRNPGLAARPGQRIR